MTLKSVRLAIIGSLLAGVPALAQDYSYAPPQQQQQGGYQSQAFAPEQLDSLVAPIALYPDPLLSQVLVAATYPQDLQDASQWLTQNGGLQGQQRIEFAQQQNWDPSIQALVAFPDVVARMTQDMRWTSDLGNAFLNQEADVMSAVQRMRQRAQQSGRLSSSAQQVVNTDYQYGEPVVEIQPADPQVIYVPSYNPAYIWGAPAYGYYPSLYYPSVGFGFGFSRGISIGAFFGGFGGRNAWGWAPRWHERSVVVNNGFFDRYRFDNRGTRFVGGNSVWSHDYSRRPAASFAGRASQQGAYSYGRNSYSQPRGFSGNYDQQRYQQQVAPRANFSGGNYDQRRFTQSYSQPQQRYQQQQQQQQVTPRSNFSGGNYNGAYNNSGRTFDRPRAAAPQTFQQQRFAAPQAAPQVRQQSAPRTDSFRNQAPQQQRFSGGERSAQPQNSSRGEGGHRR